ncbi:hypothetical protein GW17_00024114 [Ensete ventricosum]|uniref:Uncharacterized protein n=1 Tax=Ensete ventricosum TaxID=4639 RepID=A0A444EPB8_ENSVE|nr:hypothetical protein GW17_00024114 [Ensete ventricosum]RZR73875.1 hypothetical protein BHM03_00029161 [Ensete ventricosum]
MEVWRIENFAVVPIPKSFHGKFFTGDSYVILKVLLVFVGEQKSLSVGLSSNADILANVIGCVMRTGMLGITQYLSVPYVGMLEDGKLMADADAGEFWGFFGGFAPLPRKVSSEEARDVETFSVKLL